MNIRRFLLLSLLVIITSVLVSVVIMPSLLFATGPEKGNFGGNGEAWVNDYGDHYVNTNNPDNRKDWTNHRFAVPGQGGAHANENAAVIEWGAGTLVDPHDTM